MIQFTSMAQTSCYLNFHVESSFLLCCVLYTTVHFRSDKQPGVHLHIYDPFYVRCHEKCAATFVFVSWKLAFFHSNIKIGNNFIKVETSWIFVLTLLAWSILRKGSKCTTCCLLSVLMMWYLQLFVRGSSVIVVWPEMLSCS